MVQSPLHGWEHFEGIWTVNYMVWTLVFVMVAVWGMRQDTGR